MLWQEARAPSVPSASCWAEFPFLMMESQAGMFLIGLRGEKNISGMLTGRDRRTSPFWQQLTCSVGRSAALLIWSDWRVAWERDGSVVINREKRAEQELSDTFRTCPLVINLPAGQTRSSQTDTPEIFTYLSEDGKREVEGGGWLRVWVSSTES